MKKIYKKVFTWEFKWIKEIILDDIKETHDDKIPDLKTVKEVCLTWDWDNHELNIIIGCQEINIDIDQIDYMFKPELFENIQAMFPNAHVQEDEI